MLEIKNWILYISKNNFDIDHFKQGEKMGEVISPITLEEALFQKHVLADPYYSTNNWDYQKYEEHHQYYEAYFDSNHEEGYLHFDGVDTICDVYVNHVLLGRLDNCYLSFDFKVSNLKTKDNQIVLHIYPNVLEGLKYKLPAYYNINKYNVPALYLRRPTSSFGWDILPRTPLGGIYLPVYFKQKLPFISSYFVKTVSCDVNQAILSFHFDCLSDYDEIQVSGQCEDSSFFITGKNDFEVTIPQPKLWWIRGYGKPYLYQMNFKVIKNNKTMDKMSFDYGIRTIQLKRTSVVKDGGEFNFYLNGRKVFLLGSNYVPIDAIKHVDIKRSKKALKMLMDLNCNAIRIWGGGTYELDEFYHLCDQLGFFVWQDFMMACGTYPQDDIFKEKISKEVVQIVKRLRNHPSVCLWSGDNENDQAYWYGFTRLDPNTNLINRQWIPELLKGLDSTRPYLPSSPYMDEYVVAHFPDCQMAEDHLWGPRDYFKGNYYRNSYPYFTSESGYHGLNSPKSLRKFMKNPWPLLNQDGNPTKEYMCHGVSVKDDLTSIYIYRTKLMISQVETLFHDKIDNLNDFSLASQISQAEAMKYFIEKMRRNIDRNGGIIWWNLIDGWPQISDAIVDYYFEKKLAYYYIKKAQQDVLIFMDENEKEEEIYVSSLLDEDVDVYYHIMDAYDGSFVKEGNCQAKKRNSRVIDKLINDNKKHFYIIHFTYRDKKCMNTFHTNVIDIDFKQYRKVLKANGFFK